MTQSIATPGITDATKTDYSRTVLEGIERLNPSAIYHGALETYEDEMDYVRFPLKGVRVG